MASNATSPARAGISEYTGGIRMDAGRLNRWGRHFCRVIVVACILSAGCSPTAQRVSSAAAVQRRTQRQAPLPPPKLSPSEQMIVDYTNDYRRKNGAGGVALEGRLCATARYFADYMARTDQYGHRADGRAPSGRAEMQRYAWCVVRENIGYARSSHGFSDPQLAWCFFEGWRDSAGHRENMLARDVSQLGVAVAFSRQTGRYYAVQVFGQPE